MDNTLAVFYYNTREDCQFCIPPLGLHSLSSVILHISCITWLCKCQVKRCQRMWLDHNVHLCVCICQSSLYRYHLQYHKISVKNTDCYIIEQVMLAKGCQGLYLCRVWKWVLIHHIARCHNSSGWIKCIYCRW